MNPATVSLGSIDDQFQSAAFRLDPYPTYARLREESPVWFNRTWNASMVTRYSDVVTALKSHNEFSNAGRQKHLLDLLPEDGQEALRPLRRHYESGGLINSDPPLHTRLRSLIGKAFSPRVMKRLEADIEETVSDLLQPIAKNEEWDLIQTLAFPLPAIVIARLLGVPAEDRDQFKEWSARANAFAGSGKPSMDVALAAQEAFVTMKSYLADLYDKSKRRSGDDLLSALAQVREGDAQLTRAEVLATCCTLLTAGHETTTYLIGNAMLALLKHRRLRRELAANPDLMPVAIEEFLRYDSPVQAVKRVVRKDLRLRNVDLAQGSLIYAMIGSANRDPEAFPDPDRLDFHRDNKRQIAFGSGIHFCIGAALARIEARIALTNLLRKFPQIKWETDLSRLLRSPGFGLRGPQRLFLRLS